MKPSIIFFMIFTLIACSQDNESPAQIAPDQRNALNKAKSVQTETITSIDKTNQQIDEQSQ